MTATITKQIKKDFENNLSGVNINRDVLTTIDNYCKEPAKDILALSGLRRTGKTVLMMRQALSLIDAGKKVTYLLAARDSRQAELFALVNEAMENGCEFLFIDEITFIEGFADWADWVYNNTILKGCHCVIAGTDSYGLELAARDTLFDRIRRIRTTYMSYDEFARVRGGDIISYVQKGGIFRDVDIKRYINTSVVDNIADSIDRYENANRRGLDVLSSDEIRTAVIKIISRISFELTIGLLRRQYKYSDLSLSVKNLSGSVTDFVLENEQDIIDRVESEFGLNEDLSRFKDKELENILRLLTADLVELDVIAQYKHTDLRLRNPQNESYLLTQPAGRFQLTELYLQAISHLGGETAQLLCEAVSADIEGQLIEAVVLNETEQKLKNIAGLQSKRKYDVFKFNADGTEFDMVVYDKDIGDLFLYEIKRKDAEEAAQRKNFFDESLSTILNYIKKTYHSPPLKVPQKYILYRGDAQLVNGISYVNVEKYLHNLEKHGL